MKYSQLRNECIAEFIGTFLFIAIGIGSVAGLVLAGASYGQWEISIIWGLGVAIAVYVTGGVSGAHLSPSVTIALAVFGGFPKSKIIPFILSQLAGAFMGAAVVYLLYHNLFAVKDMSNAGVFTTFPNAKITILQAFMTEFFITALLLMAILALTDNDNGAPRGAMAPFLIGVVVAIIGGSFGPLTGFSMNAARDFGPRLFAFLAGWGPDIMTGGRSIPYFLIPLTAPILGGLAGSFLYKSFIGKALKQMKAGNSN